MFQRILRQLRQALPDADINIAASSSQTDSVMAQAPTDISIIIEPSRRDTFPAIALASSYLAWEKGIGKDEVVVVMPCDTFTEPGYFHAISEMSAAVESDLAELVLMGIEPESPSAKYGYIVPATSAPGIVDRFIEKPDAEKSRSLIAEGALWNGGVFAFKLGYMLDIVSGYSTHENFGKIREAYDDFPKISFDYEVAEKAKSVGIVRYNGVWKDLGTWAALCKELPDTTLGNVHSQGNYGTTILNELALPIISRGCSDIIIAASPDGILVADKESAGSIKESVSGLSLRPMYEERRWGTYRVLDSMTFADGSSALTKCLVLTPGASISYQRHAHREEVWTIVDGAGEVVTGTERRAVKPGDVIVIPSGMLHALRASTRLTLIEVQRGSELVEEDIQRFEYDWSLSVPASPVETNNSRSKH